jgi:hypothetical protein
MKRELKSYVLEVSLAAFGRIRFLTALEVLFFLAALPFRAGGIRFFECKSLT